MDKRVYDVQPDHDTLAVQGLQPVQADDEVESPKCKKQLVFEKIRDDSYSTCGTFCNDCVILGRRNCPNIECQSSTMSSIVTEADFVSPILTIHCVTTL